MARELGLSDDQIRKGFKSFTGVKRRFTRTGEHNGVTVFDDYGHHPVEIAAVLRAARGVTQSRVVAVMQPHRYTRLSSLFNDFCTCFNDADTVIVAPVYAAGEAPIEGASHLALVEGLRARGHRNVHAIETPDQLAPLVRNLVAPGDIVICLGAGTITQWAYALAGPTGGLRWRSRRVMARLDGEALLKRLPAVRGRLEPECGTGRPDLVPCRRPGRSALHARGRGRSRGFPQGHAGRRSGLSHRRGLEPSGARRRRAGRGDPPGQGLLRT